MGLGPEQGSQFLLFRGDVSLQLRGGGHAGSDLLPLRRPGCCRLEGPCLLCGPVGEILVRSRVRVEQKFLLFGEECLQEVEQVGKGEQWGTVY